MFHFVVLPTFLFSSAHSSSFAAMIGGAGRGASRLDMKGCGGAGWGTVVRRGQEVDREGPRVTGQAAGGGKAG